MPSLASLFERSLPASHSRRERSRYTANTVAHAHTETACGRAELLRTLTSSRHCSRALIHRDLIRSPQQGDPILDIPPAEPVGMRGDPFPGGHGCVNLLAGPTNGHGSFFFSGHLSEDPGPQRIVTGSRAF